MNRTLIAIATICAWCSAALGQNGDSSLSVSAAQRRLEAYVSTWSADQDVNPATVAHYYADRVIYYGKAMSRSDVLRDKLRYIAVWPERHYGIVPGTVAASCDHQRTLCRVSGIMRWQRRSRDGRQSVGNARLSLLLSRASGGKIVRESASLGPVRRASF